MFQKKEEKVLREKTLGENILKHLLGAKMSGWQIKDMFKSSDVSIKGHIKNNNDYKIYKCDKNSDFNLIDLIEYTVCVRDITQSGGAVTNQLELNKLVKSSLREFGLKFGITPIDEEDNWFYLNYENEKFFIKIVFKETYKISYIISRQYEDIDKELDIELSMFIPNINDNDMNEKTFKDELISFFEELRDTNNLFI